MAKPRGPRKQNGEATVAAVQAAPASVATDVTETIAAEPQKSLRKPSIVKSDSRSNVLPINLEDEVRQRYHQQSA
jgi:hypothetical protein